jgi:hypothetical protein
MVFTLTALAAIIIIAISVASATEPPSTSSLLNQRYGYTSHQLASPVMATGTITTGTLNNKFNNNLALSSKPFKIIDSVANGFSFFSEATQPFVWELQSNTLMIIKRGFVDLGNNPLYTGDNLKDNLFLLESSDMGDTWYMPADPLFNARKVSPPLSDNARYPSVYGFVMEGAPACVYTAPSVMQNASTWKGFIDGFYQPTYGPSSGFSRNVVTPSTNYEWGTDSKIVGGAVGSLPWALAIGGVQSPGGLDWANNSNIAVRKSNSDFSDWPAQIPPQWTTDKFYTALANGDRSNVITGLVQTTGGRIYATITGRFTAYGADSPYIRDIGVSYSDDQGSTWTEFDVCPFSKIRDYAATQTQFTFNLDSLTIPYGEQGFVLLDNGDYSFVSPLYQVDVSQSFPSDQTLKQIIEVYKENGQWGVRKVSDLFGAAMSYRDSLGAVVDNQLGVEIQNARTVDGNKIFCKWVDSIPNPNQAETGADWSIAVFGCTRQFGQKQWSSYSQLTESRQFPDRMTWIPYYIPNNLVNVPIIRLETITDPSAALNVQFAKQMDPNQTQYVEFGNIDVIASVEDNTTETNFEVNSIYPNPASTLATINVTIPTDGRLNIELCDVLGNVVRTINNDTQTAGQHSYILNTNDLSIGAYYCTFNFNNQKITKIVNVIR